MEKILLTAITFCVFLGIFLLVISIDLKDLYERIKLGAMKGTKKLEDTAENSRGSKIGKLIEYTEKLIQKSNIRMYVAYNIWGHFLITLIIGFMGYNWIINYLDKFTSLAFVVPIMTLPYMILRIICDIVAKRESKHAANFLTTFKNFYISGKNDIFEAFEKMVPYITEPLKTYVEILTEEHKGKINQFQCLENFKEKLGTTELRLWTENLSICQSRGGGTVELTEAFIQEIYFLQEDEDKEDTQDRMLNYGLYVLIFLNFIILAWILRSPYKHEVMGSLWGKAVFVFDMIICFYIAIMTLRKN